MSSNLPTDASKQAKPLTPHQKIVRAAKRGTGLRLTAEECWLLGVMDDAITTRAGLDDKGESK